MSKKKRVKCNLQICVLKDMAPVKVLNKKKKKYLCLLFRKTIPFNRFMKIPKEFLKGHYNDL